MKLKVIFFLLVFSIALVSADVKVLNYTVNNITKATEELTGKINLTITSENIDTLISSNDHDEMTLRKFLELNSITLNCEPDDCELGYKEKGIISDFINIKPYDDKLIGFKITGSEASITDINFSLNSNFQESLEIPLSILFLESKPWQFKEFSTEEFSNPSWGCFDNDNPEVSSVGSQIGPAKFCERVYLKETNKIVAGANIKYPPLGECESCGENKRCNSDNQCVDEENLTMSLCSDKGTSCSNTCEYNPNNENNCTISADSEKTFEEGYYRICVSSLDVTDYRIYNESITPTCGSVLGYSDQNIDYSIFASTAKFASNDLLQESLDISSILTTELANNYTKERYGNDCSTGCIFPIKLSGIEQKILVSDVFLRYFANNEYVITTEAIELEEIPAKVTFSGELELGRLNFNISKSMNYTLKIGNKIIFTKWFDIAEIPKIKSLYPSSAPAGVSTKFILDMDYNSTAPVKYTWDMGDGTKLNTTVPYLTHTFNELKNYIVSVSATAGKDLVDSKVFDIETITPEEAINTTLISKKLILASIQKIIDAVPVWYKQELSNTAKLEVAKSQISDIEKSRQAATAEKDYITIVKKIYDLDIPTSIDIESSESPYLMNNPDDVKIAPILQFTGESATAPEDEYKKTIIGWQNNNIDASFVKKVYTTNMLSGENGGSLSTYEFKIKSISSEESYLIVDKPLSSLHFSKAVGAKESSGYSIIPIPSLTEKSVEFYYSGNEPLSYFVSPKLSSITIESAIDTTCNYNLVCESALGETPENCRIDCMPIKSLISYVLLIFFGAIGLYTLLGVWYAKHYENYLFKDKRELYNVLMFVANAKNRGMSDGKIASELRRQGWPNEKISFIIKKSNGKKTGLPEIIPISKISAAIRKAKAKKQFSQNNVMTNSRQLPPRNINKSGFARKL